MTNKKRFKQLMFELKKLHKNNENFSVKLFPIRKKVSELVSLDDFEKIMEEVKLDMVSIDSQDEKFDIYQKYFEDYDIDNNSLTVNFKYNKQREINLV